MKQENPIIIKGSITGIASQLLKYLIILLVFYLVFNYASNLKAEYYLKHSITSFFSFVMALEHIDSIIILFIIFLVYILVFLVYIYCAFKILLLFYEIPKKTVIDMNEKKIISIKYSFPLFRNVETNKINQIINVTYHQDLISRLLDSGNLYIEFLSFSPIDSQKNSILLTEVSKIKDTREKLVNVLEEDYNDINIHSKYDNKSNQNSTNERTLQSKENKNNISSKKGTKKEINEEDNEIETTTIIDYDEASKKNDSIKA